MNATNIPAALASLSERYGIDVSPWLANGCVDLRIDAYPRVSLRRGAGERLELHLWLGELPHTVHDREALLEKLMLRVTAGARICDAVLAAAREQLWLQSVLQDEQTVEEALEALLNQADYWSGVLQENT